MAEWDDLPGQDPLEHDLDKLEPVPGLGEQLAALPLETVWLAHANAVLALPGREAAAVEPNRGEEKRVGSARVLAERAFAALKGAAAVQQLPTARAGLRALAGLGAQAGLGALTGLDVPVCQGIEGPARAWAFLAQAEVRALDLAEPASA